jgi:hypothetical protein
MGLSSLTKNLIETKLAKYCERRIPEHARSQVRIAFKLRGNTVTLSEERPLFADPSTWVSVTVAQFRFDPAGNKWTLYCADRNSRWHQYEGMEPHGDLDKLLREVDRDPTGIFWG